MTPKLTVALLFLLYYSTLEFNPVNAQGHHEGNRLFDGLFGENDQSSVVHDDDDAEVIGDTKPSGVEKIDEYTNPQDHAFGVGVKDDGEEDNEGDSKEDLDEESESESDSASDEDDEIDEGKDNEDDDMGNKNYNTENAPFEYSVDVYVSYNSAVIPIDTSIIEDEFGKPDMQLISYGAIIVPSNDDPRLNPAGPQDQERKYQYNYYTNVISSTLDPPVNPLGQTDKSSTSSQTMDFNSTDDPQNITISTNSTPSSNETNSSDAFIGTYKSVESNPVVIINSTSDPHDPTTTTNFSSSTQFPSSSENALNSTIGYDSPIGSSSSTTAGYAEAKTDAIVDYPGIIPSTPQPYNFGPPDTLYNLTVQEDDSATFSCNYTIPDYVKPSVLSWWLPTNNSNPHHVNDTVVERFPNGSSLHSSILVLDKVDLRSSGMYICRNSLNGKSSGYNLTVLVRQSLELTGQIIFDDERAEVTCTLISRANESDIVWIKNGVPRPYAYTFSVNKWDEVGHHIFTSTLLLFHPTKSDSGTYRCRDSVTQLRSETTELKFTAVAPAVTDTFVTLTTESNVHVVPLQTDEYHASAPIIPIALIVGCVVLFIAILAIVARVYSRNIGRTRQRAVRPNLWPAPPPVGTLDKPPAYDQCTSSSDGDAPTESTALPWGSPPPSYSSGTSHQVLPSAAPQTSMPDLSRLTTFQSNNLAPSSAGELHRRSENNLLQNSRHLVE